MRFINISIFEFFNKHLINYPTPINLNYFFSFGSLSGIFLIFQIISGIFLCMHYTPEIVHAWLSLEHICRNVNFGWLLRYIHSNGAGFFFILIYLHISKGLYFKSYRNFILWFSGILILILIMATAFIGYVLPWGAMSFWGATVITTLFSAIPWIGDSIVFWLWGGFSINNATLNRFFSLHYLLPFLIVSVVLIHLSLLHLKGSTNPVIPNLSIFKINFYPYFFLKDIFSLFFILLNFAFFIFYIPNILGHNDNYIQANPLVTPPHIVPEFYFLTFYAILRAIPSKLSGVFCMGFSIICLLCISFLDYFAAIQVGRFRFIFKNFFWFFIFLFIFLSFLGSKPVENPYVYISQISTFLYFSYFLIFLPLLNFFDLICMWRFIK